MDTCSQSHSEEKFANVTLTNMTMHSNVYQRYILYAKTRRVIMTKLRKLGSSDLLVHPVGVGCWSFGGGAYWGEQSQSDVNNVVSQALDIGLNLFDTAEMYNNGDSEVSLGEALKGKRNKAVVISKISPANCRPKTLVEHLEASLRKLQTDYLDIYMLHWPINRYGLLHFTNDQDIIDNQPTVQETFETLDKLKKQGKIRSIGVSNFGVKQMQEVHDTGVVIDVNEIAYNIMSRAIEKEILPHCIEHNVSIICSMVLQQGLLADIYKRVEDIPPAQAHSRHFKNERGQDQSRHFEPGAEEEVFAALAELRKISADLNIPMAQLAVAWALHKQGIDNALVGSRNIDELMDNVKASELVLSPDIIAAIDMLGKPVLDKLGHNADYYENTKNSRIY